MKRAAIAFLVVEGVLGAAWWTMLLLRPDLGRVFLPADVPPDMIRTFVLADLAAYVLLPLVTAWRFTRGCTCAWPLLVFHAGTAAYAALWGWGTVLVTGEGMLGAALMTPSALILPWLAWRVRAERGA